MGNLKKHLLFSFIALSIFGIGLLINTLILPATNDLYQYIPGESDVVIEINAINFAKETGQQWVYAPEHFDLEPEEEKQKMVSASRDIGIDLFSKILIFNEQWSEESLWFAVMAYNNQEKLATFIESNFPKAKLNFEKNVAIVQLSKSKNQAAVDQYIGNIFARKVKSIEANPLIKKQFLNENEINIYLKSLKSEYISDGYLSINFETNQIDIDGYFHPIGSTSVRPIAYATDKDIGLSLRSSLNLLNTIYLFRGTKLEYLPDYEQIALDYDGATLLTNNDVIPVTSYPNINMQLDIYDDKTWLQYIDASIEDGSLLVAQDTIMINSEVKAKLRYKIANQKFELFQASKSLQLAKPDNQTYFELIVHPSEIIEKMVFKEDSRNPPKLVASQIIKIVKSLLEDFHYIKAIDEINFVINKQKGDENYISSGHIVYHNIDSHSTIESYFLFRNLMQTFGNFLH
ncbi:MAG: hypothetical protein R3279_07065 [Putridiphycobacter sp.]|nr:hypothetical protein [Putridiphycobacter sp.]